MVNYRKIVVLSAVLIAVAPLASFAWAGDVKGKVTAQGMRSPENIVVVPTPYFAVTDKEGGFTIKDVPPGQYTLKTWSEEAKPATQAVTVGSGVVSVNLTVMK